MSVVPMQKVRLLVHATDVDPALDIIQRAGALEFRATDMHQVVKPNVFFPHANLLPRVQHSVNFLEQYAPKVGLWKKLREGSQTTLTEKEVIDSVRDTDAPLAVVEDTEQLQVEFANVNEKISVLEDTLRVLFTWKTLPIKLSHLSTSFTTTLLIQRISVVEKTSLSEDLRRSLSEQSLPFNITEVSNTAVAVTLPKEDATGERLEKLIESHNAEIIPAPPGVETPDVELIAVSEQLATARGELALLHDQAEHIAFTHYKQLRILSEILSWRHERFSVIESAGATKYTMVFDGWLNKNRKAAIEQKFESKNLNALFMEVEPLAGEEPPVDIENSALIQPFETVTRLYGMPGYKDLDPTVFLAGFFFLFFGMSLTDVGYGLFLMVVSVIILTLFKVAPQVRMFSKLLLFVGFSTVLVGLLFGGYLGIAPEHIPDFLKKLQVYDPIGNPLPVFYTALGLGVVQVMAGLILSIYSGYRQGKLMDSVLDKGPWLFVFFMGILYLGAATGYVSFLATEQIINLIYVGVVMIVLASGRKGDSILAKVRSAALSLYDSIGYFSDILSYSRLLALGLATTALAFAVNMIASMVVDIPFVGAALALIILIIGHLFTLAVNTLGAFIHSARLQFVEFFGKFVAGTGRSFAPLSRTEKHVTVRDE